MGCKTIALPGGATAIVCSRGRSRPRERCRWCTAPGTLLCDGLVPDPVQAAAQQVPGFGGGPARVVTCDKALCATHAVQVGPDRHFCPACAKAAAATPVWDEREAAE